MGKTLRLIALLALLLGAPLGLRAEVESDDVETEQHAVTLSVSGDKINIGGAEGLVLEVYNLTGVKVASYRIDSESKQMSLSNLPKGYYILKVGDVVRKVSLR